MINHSHHCKDIQQITSEEDKSEGELEIDLLVDENNSPNNTHHLFNKSPSSIKQETEMNSHLIATVPRSESKDKVSDEINSPNFIDVVNDSENLNSLPSKTNATVVKDTKAWVFRTYLKF